MEKEEFRNELIEQLKKDIKSLEDAYNISSDVVKEALKNTLTKKRMILKNLERRALKDAANKDLKTKDRSNGVINSNKYKKAKNEYQYRLANSIPIKVKDLCKKYKVNENTMYQWIGRYDWKDLTGFINIRPDLLDVTPEEKEKMINTTIKGKNILTQEFMNDLAELVKFVDSKGKGYSIKQICAELNDKGHDISESYLYKLKGNNMTIFKIFEAGEKIREVEQSLYKRATGQGKIKSIKVKEVMTKQGIQELTEETISEKEADVNAAKFFLEKRDSKNWGVTSKEEEGTTIVINIGGLDE